MQQIKQQFTVAAALAATWVILAGAPVARATDPFLCRPADTLPQTPLAAGAEEATNALCAVDFSSDHIAICPKTWSTSAAALVYDLSATVWEKRSRDFEASVCAEGTHARDKAGAELAVFKHSMNFRDTSGTYAPAVLLYDHLSRWLNTTVQVPAAVEYRFSSDWYRERVVQPGLALAARHPSRKMLLAAWQHLDTALKTPVTERQGEYFLQDGSTLWGAALLFTGRRYGAEINGTRESGWGSGQNYDFQHTAPFLALRHDGDLAQSVAFGVQQARSDPTMAQALPAAIEPLQVKWWMIEILDTVVLDYLLGQQDRIGNIDYQWRWLWLDDGHLQTMPAATSSPPYPGAVKLRTTWLNDNDAGVRSGYANYAKKTGMLDGLRHFNPALYKRLKLLAGDLAGRGPVYQSIAANYHLRTREVEAIVARMAELDRIITADCQAGRYRFDLQPVDILLQPAPAGASIACD